MEITSPTASDGDSEGSLQDGRKVLHAGKQSMSETASSRSADGPLCRICQIGSSDEPLLSPCNCKGSLGLIHRSCVEKWLSQSNSDQCEICKFHYTTVRHPKSLWQWLREADTHTDHRHLLADIACFLLVLPLAATSAWLCVSGGLHYLRHPSVTSWEGCGLIALASILALVFLCWSYVTIRYHWHVWQVWRSRNFNIELRDVKKGRRSRDCILGSESTTSFVFVHEMQPTMTSRNAGHLVLDTGER